MYNGVFKTLFSVEAFCGIFKEKSSLTRALTEHREKDKHREEKKIAG